MVRRVFEGVLIGVVSSVLTLWVSTSAGRNEFLDGFVGAVGYGAPAQGAFWGVAAFLACTSALCQLRLWTSRESADRWGVSLAMLRLPGALLWGCGLCAVAGLAVRLGGEGSRWAVPLSCMAVYGVYRSVARMRYQLVRAAGF